MIDNLPTLRKLFVKQAFELAEIFGIESRNKYRITDETGRELGFVAEQQKGLMGFLFKQYLGHWRTFEIHFFDSARQQFMVARHPFRWFFQALELLVDNRKIGTIERRFSIFSKRFEVLDARGQTLFEVTSPIWRIWTFEFLRRGQEVARVSKKWTGFEFELFTDKDTFLIEFKSESLTAAERALVLASAIYIDLMFFERKAS